MRTLVHALVRTAPIAAALLVAPARTLAQEDVEAILARARAALGWERVASSQGAVEVHGAARFLGTDAEQTLLFDGRGRFVNVLEGPLAQWSGFDGETFWSVDWTRTPRVLELGDRTNAEVMALFLTGGWAAAGGPLEFELAPEPPEGELALEFDHADGVMTGVVHLDAQTCLPRKLSFGPKDGHSLWTFTDYRSHDGFSFPQRMELAQEGLAQSLETSSVELLAKVADERFAPRLAPPGDTRFDPEVQAALEVKKVPSGHLLVHPTIDDKDLGWFIFDSGAGINCIDKKAASQLGGEPFGEIRARGIGGTIPAHFRSAREMRLGPMTVEGPIFMELDLAFLEQHFGVPVGGIVGYELFARCTVELDITGAAIALNDPADYALPEQSQWEDALLYGRHPCVRASVEEREGVFKIDTGAAGDTVTMHYQAVIDLGLLEGRETRAGAAGGVGGQVSVRSAELASFDLGGRRFAPVQASFALEDKGAFSDAYVWGNIGGELIEPFVLVFDYPHRRIGFVPRGE